MGTCTLELPLDHFGFAASSGSGGTAWQPLQLLDPSLHGAVVYTQGFVLDPAGEFLNLLAFTNGLRFSIGR